MKKHYFELTRLIEKLHRRYIDVLKAELNRIGVRDINGVQALLLTNIGAEEISIRDLVERGYYLGSNVSYNIKKLTDLGYLEQERSAHDKRSVNVRLTERALDVVTSMQTLQDYNADAFAEKGATPESIDDICQGLQSLERTWSDYIHYGMKAKA
ncbi:MAG: MarR family transcriptional regulator [Alphaproteobacteria bacterium]|nr:MarR family transcriptional regulator [Alphaproteobacteria bacterium]